VGFSTVNGAGIASINGSTVNGVVGGAFDFWQSAVTDGFGNALCLGQLLALSTAYTPAIPIVGGSSAWVGLGIIVSFAPGAVPAAQLGGGTLRTAPAATAAQAITLGTSLQNTLGYDAILLVSVSVATATAATITAGVGPATGPAAQTIVPSFTAAALEVYTFSLYVPAGYFALVSDTGTISATATGQWQPV
jgi:hypothetical protein